MNSSGLSHKLVKTLLSIKKKKKVTLFFTFLFELSTYAFRRNILPSLCHTNRYPFSAAFVFICQNSFFFFLCRQVFIDSYGCPLFFWLSIRLQSSYVPYNTRSKSHQVNRRFLRFGWKFAH